MKRLCSSPFIRWHLCGAALLLLSGSASAEPPRTDRLGDPLPDGAVARLGTMRLRHDRAVTAVAFAPDGKTLASGDVNGDVRIWETATGRELHCLPNHHNVVLSLAYSPDGKLLASAGGFDSIFLWDPATGAKRGCLDESNLLVGAFCLAFSPDGKTLAGGVSGSVVWWDVAARTRLRCLDGEHGTMHSIAYARDGKTLAYACRNQEISLCDPATGKLIRTLRKPQDKEEPFLWGVAYSPDAKKLLVAERDGCRSLDAASGKEVQRMEEPTPCSRPVFAPNGRFAAVMSVRGHPWVWDWKRNKDWEFEDHESTEAEATLAVSADSKFLASGGSNGRIRLWDMTARKQVIFSAGEEGGARAVALNAFELIHEGKILKAWDDNHRLRLWKMPDVKFARVGQQAIPRSLVVLVSLPDHSKSVVLGRDEMNKLTIQVLDVARGRRRWYGSIAEKTPFEDRRRIAVYSPDGKRLAVSGTNPDIDLWDAATGQQLGRLRGHANTVATGLFSPDGKSLVTASADHTVRVWEVESKRERHRLLGHGGGATVSHLAFSADGKYLASGGDDSRICVWDAATGRRLHRWAIQEEEYVSCLALSADGKTLLANAGKGRFRLWDVASGTASPIIEGHRDAVTFAAFLPDGRSLLTGSRDGTALVWDLAALRRRRPPQPAPLRADANGDPLPPGILARLGSTRLRHDGWIYCAAYSPDGKILATASDQGEMEGLRLWDAASGKELHRLPKGRFFQAQQIAFSPDGKVLATLTGAFVRFWDVASGVSLGIALRHKDQLSSFAFAPDGKRLAVATEHGIFLWDLDNGDIIRAFDKPTTWSHQIVFTEDGNTLLAADGVYRLPGKDQQVVPGTIGVWDVATGKRRRNHSDIKCTLLKLSPDGRTFVYLDADKRLHLCDGLTGAELWVSTKEGPNCRFSADGKHLLTGERGQPFRVRESATGKEVRRSSAKVNFAGSWLCLSPDGATLAAASDSHRIELWNVATGRERHPFGGHWLAVTCLAFDPDGRTLVSGSDDGTLRLWDALAGKELRALHGSEKSIKTVAFSRDGKTITSGDSRNVVRLWEAATGKEVWRFEGPPSNDDSDRNGMQSVAFSPDGRTLIAGSGDGTIYLWDAAAHKLRRQFRGYAASASATIVSSDGKLLACASNDGNVLMRVWEAATGRQVLEIGARRGALVKSIAFSPDGKLLAASESRYDPWQGTTDSRISFYELAGGRELFHLDTIESIAGFSPDGRYLITNSGSLWDMSTGRKTGAVGEWRRNLDAFAFAPDGRIFASGSSDTTILIQSLPHSARRKPLLPHEPSARELQVLWTDLSALDPPRPWLAMRTLIETPRQSVPFLQTMLRPHPPLNRDRLKRLLADLDSDAFAEREQARREIAKLAELAEPALRRTLDGKPSLEVRRQVLALLEQIDAAAPESLRVLRVTTVLERIDTPESLALLRRLAGGATEARLTREAAAAVERMKRRNIKP